MHMYYLSNVRKKLETVSNCSIEKDAFYKEMTVAQGSNFTGLALAAWIMLSVAIVYLYFLVPTILPYSYMMIPLLASKPIGFLLLGLGVAIIALILILGLDKLPETWREFKLTELYSFYNISKTTKKLIGLAVPALFLSIICSAFLGTIYPAQDVEAQTLAFLFLAASVLIMTAPIYREALGAMK